MVVKHVQLVHYTGSQRIEIGTATVDENGEVCGTFINSEAAEKAGLSDLVFNPNHYSLAIDDFADGYEVLED